MSITVSFQDEELTAGQPGPAAGTAGSRGAVHDGVAPLDEGQHHVAEALETLAHGQSLLGPEVDALEDRRDLEEGEPEVPGQRLEVEVALPVVAPPEVIAAGIAGNVPRDGRHRAVQATHPVPPDERGRQIG